jgi:glycosyltransferase involved in cell wall biosynthesis
MSVKHGIVSAEDLANKLNQLYTNKELYNELSQKTLEKFTAKEYSWDYIVEEKMLPSFEKLWK